MEPASRVAPHRMLDVQPHLRPQQRCPDRSLIDFADDARNRSTTCFLGVWARPPRLTAPLGLVRAGLFSLNGGPFLFCTLPVSYCVPSATN